MVSINYSLREVCCKIVYYGPGLSGKTTNLQYVHSKVPSDTRGRLVSLATEADRTLYFDFLPINIGTINGFQAKFQLYTVPGQVYYNATRKLVLRGVDGIVFVADSQPDKVDENLESLANLVENLSEYGYDINELPVVIQYNKRDLPAVLPVEELQLKLNEKGWPYFEASATVGNGVFDTLKLIIKLVLEKAKSTSSPKIAPTQKAAVTPAPPEMERVPVEQVDAAPVSQTSPESSATAGSVSVQAAPPTSQPDGAGVHPETEEDSAYRPYPGSVEEKSRQKRISQASFPAATRGELDAESLEKNIVSDEDSAARKSRDATVLPQMAPSLRRRGLGKKRGFFKRLFGVK